MKSKLAFICLFLLLSILTSCEKDYIIPDDVLAEEKGKLHEESSDYIWDEADVIYITLNGSSISSGSSGTIVNGSTLTITSAGTYSISGTLTNGQIIVNAPDEATVRLIFNGLNITCSSSAPVYIMQAEKVIINLASNTENYITDGSSYSTTDEPNAAIFSKSDLTIFGEGELTVNANYNDGISSKDGFLIKSGTINVNAKDDGIRGKDFLVIRDVNITINAGGDGLKSDYEYGFILFEAGTVNISAGDDGMHAESYITINDATISITNSVEGIESASITVNSGNINIVSSDDGFNATAGSGGEENDGSCLNIYGGVIVVNSSVGDGLDSNGNITITAGKIIVHGPQQQPEVGMDYNGTCNITGGLLIMSGSNSNMTQGPSTSSTQYSLKLITTSSNAAGELFHIQDSDGNEIITFKPVRSYYSIIFSSPDLQYGSSYNIYIGGTTTGTEYYGLYENGSYTPGTLYKSFTISSIVTSIGTSGNDPHHP